MKRFGILVLVGVFAIVGCAKKKTENAATGAETAAGAARIAGAIGGGQAAAKAPQLAATARAAAIARSHNPNGAFPGWDAATKELTFSGTANGYTTSTRIKFKRADGTVIDLAHDGLVAVDTTTFATTAISSNAVASMDMSLTASKSDGSSQSFVINIKDNGTTATINGTGTIKDTAQKVDLTITLTNMTAGETGLVSGTMTGTGTADSESFSLSITWTNGVGDGTITTDKETAKIHIEKDGSGYWEDSKGEKHNFAA